MSTDIREIIQDLTEIDNTKKWGYSLEEIRNEYYLYRVFYTTPNGIVYPFDEKTLYELEMIVIGMQTAKRLEEKVDKPRRMAVTIETVVRKTTIVYSVSEDIASKEVTDRFKCELEKNGYDVVNSVPINIGILEEPK